MDTHPWPSQPLIRPIAVFVAATVAASFLFIQLSSIVSRFVPEKLVGLIAPVGMLLFLFFLTRLMLARDGRSPRELGLDLTPRWAREWLAGLLGGVALVAVWCVVVWIGAPFHWEPNPDFEAGAMMASLALLAASNTGEELCFRGYVFDRLIEKLGVWWSQIIIAVIFAAWHIWQGVPWIAALTMTTVASILFGAVVLRWRSIPAAAGLHTAANFVRDMVLPLSVNSATAFVIVPHTDLSPQRLVLLLVLMSAIPLIAGFFLTRDAIRKDH